MTPAFEAGRRAPERLRRCSKRGEPFAFESTLSSRSLAGTIVDARETGYRLTLVYIWVPSADVAIERVARRKAGGGHGVPPEVVRRRYGLSLANLRDLYLPLADTFRIYDHSVAGEPRRIIEGLRDSRRSCTMIEPGWR